MPEVEQHPEAVRHTAGEQSLAVERQVAQTLAEGHPVDKEHILVRVVAHCTL